MKKRISKLTTGLLLVASIATTAFGQWQNVGTAGFSNNAVYYPSLALNSNGEPYLAFSDNGHQAKVMRFDGLNWVNVGTAVSAGDAEYLSLTIDFLGAPIVSFKDNNSSGKATLKKYDYNGSTWATVGYEGFSSGVAKYTSIVYNNSRQVPIIAYQDAGQADRVVVKGYFKNLSNMYYWGNIGTALSISTAEYIKLAITDSDPIYVAFKDNYNNGKLTVKKSEDYSSWQIVGTEGFSPAAIDDDISLAINNITGQPFVAFRDGANSGKASVMKFNGTSWVNVGTAGFTPGGAYSISLAINSNGEPYVAFKDGANSGKASVMKFNGTSWVNVGTAGFTPGGVNYLSLVLNGNGDPYLAFADLSNSGKATVMKYVELTTGINDFNVANSINIFPNPTKGQLNFSMQTNAQLTSITGQIIADKKNINTLDISEQTAGIYFLTLTDNNGQVIHRSKIVKE